MLLYIFWAIYVLRVIQYGWESGEGFEKLLFALGSTLLPSLVFLSAQTTAELRRVYQWLLYAGALVSLAALYLVWTSFGFMAGETSRAGLQSLNPISYGHLGASVALLGAWYVIDHTKGRSLAGAAIACGALAIGLLAVVVSASRGPMLSLLSALTMAIVVRVGFKSGSNRIVARLRALGLGAVLIGVVWFGLPFVEEHYGVQSYSRMQLLVDKGESDQSEEGRLEAWHGAIEQFLNSPLIGDYLVERTTGFYPHNAVIEAFMVTGIIGGVPFLVWFLTAATAAVRLLKNAGLDGWVSLLAIQYLTGAMFSGALWGNSTMWYFGNAAIAHAFVYRRHSKRKRTRGDSLDANASKPLAA